MYFENHVMVCILKICLYKFDLWNAHLLIVEYIGIVVLQYA